MRTRLLASTLLSLPLLLGTVTAHAQAVSAGGYGVVRFGQKLSLAQAHMREMAKPDKREAPCDYVTFVKYPSIRFMVENGVITRAESRRWLVNTARIKEGMTVEEVRLRHPAIVITSHKYDETGHSLTLASRDGKSAIVLEARLGKVKAVRAGTMPSVDYVE